MNQPSQAPCTDLSKRNAQYLNDRLEDLIGNHPKKAYWRAYQMKRIQRFLLISMLVFFLQYLTVMHLITYPILPIYPPIGSAFVIWYFLGRAALPGLCLGGFFAYGVQGLNLPSVILSVTADLSGGYLVALWGGAVLSSDYALFEARFEGLRFMIYTGAACWVSALFRIWALDKRGITISGFDCLNLWLADLNAVFVLSGFFLRWMAVYLGRELISKHQATFIDRTAWVLWGLTCLVSLVSIPCLIGAIILSLYLAHRFGTVIASAISYVVTTMFLIGFTFHHIAWLAALGQMSPLIPCGLLCFLFSMSCASRACSIK